MSKVHVLKSDNMTETTVVIHTPIPENHNLVGFTLQFCAIACGITGSTILSVGDGPGDITQEEHNQIVEGAVVELVRKINPGDSPSNESVEELVDISILEFITQMTSNLRYYGHTIE